MSLHNVKEFHNFIMETMDGKAGTIRETLFDDEEWVIRYFVVETGDWLSNREILVAPQAVLRVDWGKGVVYVNLTKEQIRTSPGLDVTNPVLQVQEAEFFSHYGYVHYWTGLPPGSTPGPSVVAEEGGPAEPEAHDPALETSAERDLASISSRLHSSTEMIGCAVRTSDNTDGKIEDLRFDDEGWPIQYLVVDPHDWARNRSVLVPPGRADHVAWEDGQVVLGMTRAELEHCPKL